MTDAVVRRPRREADMIEALQTDTAEAATTLMQHAVGNLPAPTQSRSTRTLQERLKRLCAVYDDGRRTMQEFLRAVGHSIRFSCD